MNKENRRRKKIVTTKKQIKGENEDDVFEPEKQVNIEAILSKSPLKSKNIAAPLVSPPKEKYNKISETPKMQWISKTKTPSKQLFNDNNFLQPENPSPPVPIFKTKSPQNRLSLAKNLRQSRLRFVKLERKQDDVSFQ